MSSKTIVLTGVTSGLGLALSKVLIAEGHHVFGCGRRGNPLPHVDPQYFSYRQLDILDKAGVTAWAKSIQEENSVDILIQNAAVMQEAARLENLSDEQIDRLLDINVKGTIYVLRAFLPKMRKKRQGIIITLSSGAGRYGITKIPLYCASKFAIEGLTKSLAEELNGNMAAIPLSPGVIDTPMLRTNFGEAASQYQQPDDWAKRAVPYMLSLGREHNGQSLEIPEG